MIKRVTMALAATALLVAMPLAAEANHSWGTYHWARSTDQVEIKVIDSMTTNWDAKLGLALSSGGPTGWNYLHPLYGKFLNITVTVPGDDSSKTRKRCAAVSGQVRACNATYGQNGWLGLAQIWISGGHIVAAIAKMNDTYLGSSWYGDIADQHVICQELGHDWGLDHQDESGADLNTCMDYSSALDNPYPNDHDYEQLKTIYAGHLESAVGSRRKPRGFLNADVRAQANWGNKAHESANGRSAIFVRDFGAGLKILTHVTWAQ